MSKKSNRIGLGEGDDDYTTVIKGNGDIVGKVGGKEFKIPDSENVSYIKHPLTDEVSPKKVSAREAARRQTLGFAPSTEEKN